MDCIHYGVDYNNREGLGICVYTVTLNQWTVFIMELIIITEMVWEFVCLSYMVSSITRGVRMG